jgi:N-acyl-D-aspartate/D-glutamate deacylase
MTTPAAARTALIGGLVADGSGAEPRLADVLLSEGRIEAVVSTAERPAEGYDAAVIDCAGRVVAPGFVDIHCHSDISLLAYPGNASRVTQGVTTEVVGNCGMSPAPGNADPAGLAAIISTINVTPDFAWTWNDLPGWLDALEEAATATNVAAQVGHGSARFSVTGVSTAELDSAQLAQLERELEAAFDAGVVGASVGLMYAPGESARRAELERVARVVARRGGVLSAHLRDYRPSHEFAAIDEVAEPAACVGARVQISHLRGVGDEGDFGAVLDHVEELRRGGDVAADLYPYVHGHTTLLQLLPSELRALGPEAVVEACRSEPRRVAELLRRTGHSNEQIIVMKAAKTPGAVGHDLNAAPGDPFAWLVELLVANDGMVDVAVESGRWADVDAAFARAWVSVASDGTALEASHTASAAHPRSWGAFSAGYRRLRDNGVAIGEVVRRMTTGPASRVGLQSGIAPGRRADLVVLDDALFDSAATFAAPASPSVGLDHVYVNGVAVLESGRQTAARPGALIRGPQTAARASVLSREVSDV